MSFIRESEDLKITIGSLETPMRFLNHEIFKNYFSPKTNVGIHDKYAGTWDTLAYFDMNPKYGLC